jgi:hypothetical protein
LLFEKNEEKKLRLNYKILFPLIAALWWTIYWVGSNYLIKTSILTSFQWMFYCEFSITLLIILVYLGKSIKEKNFDFTINKNQLLSNIIISFFIFVWALWFFIAYSKIWWNYVNIIGLTQIPILSILSYVFLHDKMTKSQIITITSAFSTLLLFIIV